VARRVGPQLEIILDTDLVNLQRLIALLRSEGVVEYHAGPAGEVHLKLGPVPGERPIQSEAREGTSPRAVYERAARRRVPTFSDFVSAEPIPTARIE
jgi:hypothetical protein